MPRNQRCVMPGQAYHITQRGTNRQRVFFTDSDRSTYLRLISQNLEDAGVRVLAWCLMRNHVHFVAVPERDDSLSVLLRRVHGRFAQMMNARLLRSGHLWQNRFYSCALSPTHLWRALADVERNAVRAGLAARPEEYKWSSAAAHLEPHLSRWLQRTDSEVAELDSGVIGVDLEANAAGSGELFGEVVKGGGGLAIDPDPDLRILDPDLEVEPAVLEIG